MEYIKDGETLDDLQLGGMCVIQKEKAFRFGVDAVLLANYAKVKRGYHVVDMCSGTGIIPFILAAKTEAKSITGIEIQQEMTEMAQRSVCYNKVEQKVNFINGDIKAEILLKSIPKADVVTVNPPYKLYNSGIVNPEDKNAIARHEICCKLEDVIKAARILLKDNGRLYMVHRPERMVDMMILLRQYKLEPKSIRMIFPNKNKAPNIMLVEAQRDGGAFLKWEAPLYIYDDKGNYTDELERIYGRIK